MDQLALLQSALSKKIKSLHVGYIRVTDEKKNQKFLEQKLSIFEELWKEFEERDDEIRSNHAEKIDHLYFTEDLYTQVKKIYNDVREDINDRLQVVKEATQVVEDPQKIGGNLSATSRHESNSEQECKVALRMFNFKKKCIGVIIGKIQYEGKSREYLKEKIIEIQSTWTELMKHNDNIHMLHSNPEELGYDEEEFFEISESVNEILISLNEEMTKGEMKGTHVQHESSMTKLPPISILKFDGNYSTWMQFHDIFEQMIEKQPISNVQKLYYLKAYVSGEAERLIRHISVTDDNFDVAWKLLKDRYSNERLTISTILEKLLNQPMVTTGSARLLKGMFDTTKECILMLEKMGIQVYNSWDAILLHLLIKKLDKDTHSFYEQTLKVPRKLQSLKEFLNCLETRYQSLEALGHKPNAVSTTAPKRTGLHLTNKINTPRCNLCNKTHWINSCYKFLSIPAAQRRSEIVKLQLCFNCLKKGHAVKDCNSSSLCRKCSKKHHTLLHIDEKVRENDIPKNSTSNVSLPQLKNEESYVFLGTVLGSVEGRNKEKINCRILIDSGSQLNFISDRLQKRLKLDTNRQTVDIFGIGKSLVQSTDRVHLNLSSNITGKEVDIEAQVIKEITSCQPQKFFDISSWPIPPNIKLADPNFNKPQKVDILLGAEVYADVVQAGQIKLGKNHPILQQTIFGWMILGKLSEQQNKEFFAGVTQTNLDENLKRFWEIEEMPDEEIKLTAAEKKCEEFFKQTTYRDSSGKFIVNIPMLANPSVLGDSRSIAFKRLLNLEKKLARNPVLKKNYIEFLRDYESQGHMEQIPETTIPEIHYVIPHHCIERPESSTTKLRVVFDASCKTKSNLSLNDLMMKGPKVQEELFNILLRFRSYKCVITADIKQMYRQIAVAEEDQPLQLIMWRDDPRKQIQYYKLKTVTYGTRSSPYLATRCLKQLSEEEELRYPLAAKAIHDFYVDDIITGCDSAAEALELQRQLRDMLGSAKMRLHKWASNNGKVLQGIPDSEKEVEKVFEMEETGYIKTLGLSWQPENDQFTFTITWPSEGTITKRKIMSEIARLFDPLGLVSPVIIKAKILIQQLWKEKIDWDEELGQEFQETWKKFREELNMLSCLKIRRYIFSNSMVTRIELHGFADASEGAYGAVIYSRSINMNDVIKTKLLCSKSRVAPVKLLTIPRLELCAAQLVTKLMKKVKAALKQEINEVYYWTDSQIVLSWIQGEPALYKTYVAHRITSILESSTTQQWNYVASKRNPADLVSRGVTAANLIDSSLWFRGPSFLSLDEKEWPNRGITCYQGKDEERKTANIGHKVTHEESTHPILTIDHRNSFEFLQRTVAYMLIATQRFKRQRPSSQVAASDLNEALKEIVKVVQLCSFKQEINQLKESAQVHKGSRIYTLAPFLDNAGIIRVGGRLEKAAISYDSKHPMLLPTESFVSKLIIKQIHLQHLHAGPSAIVAISRQRFWILQAKTLAKTIVNNCVKCVRMNPKMFCQKMGDLPTQRVLPARPFLVSGVDFCGPIWTHFHIRGKRPQKSYLAVFCCFTTKAVHIEVVSDLTSESFIGALRRFMARRGLCKDLYCDNATNFVGAKNMLTADMRELEEILLSPTNQNQIQKRCQEKGVQFHFAPPRSPHFGGLWEAAVKSAKKLLKSILSPASLTFEELCTISSEAEAILNSRPLTPLSSSPLDIEALTPGHFLIGEPLTTIPNPEIKYKELSNLTRWKLVNAVRQEFWSRWSKEYLSELQKRYKWAEISENAIPGMMVLIKEDNTTSLNWPLGIITETIKGTDGLVRVAMVKTSKGIYKRAIANLAPLPIENSETPNTNTILSETSNTNKQNKRTIYNTPGEEIPSKKIRKKSNVLSLTLMTLLVMPLIVFGEQILKPYKLTSLNQTAGIFMEQLGPGRLILSEWNVVMYYNMTRYWQAHHFLQEGVIKLKESVKNTTHRNYISAITNQYEHQLTEIQQINELLFNESSRQRKRRGLVNIVGNVANVLFGVLDDKYAAEIETKIHNTNKNQKYLLELMKNQTSLIENTNLLMQKSHLQHIQNFEKVQAEFQEIINATSWINNQIQQQRFEQAVILYAQYIALAIKDFKEIQEKILNILTDIHHKKIDPLMISPTILKEHFEEIKNSLPENVRIPTLSQLYGLITIKCKLNSQLIIFRLQVPLISRTRWDIFKFTPFPIRIKKLYMMVEPVTEYILTNSHRDMAYTLSESSLQQCVNLEEEYICKQNHLYYQKTSKQLQCEFQLLYQQKIADQCPITIYKPFKFWIQLKQANNWLFTLDDEVLYNLVCDDIPYPITLQQTGILTLYDDCILKDADIFIQSYKRKTTQEQLKLPLLVNMPQDINITLSKIPTIKLLNFSNEILQGKYSKIKEQIHQLVKSEGEYEIISHHDIHQYTISYIGLFIVVAIIIVLFTRRRNGIHSHQQTPTTVIQFTKRDFQVDTGDVNEGEDV